MKELSPIEEEDPADRAILLAKTARTAGVRERRAERNRDGRLDIAAMIHRDNEGEIKNALLEKEGDLQIEGWKAQRVSEDIYLVTFTFDQGEGPRGWAFEVNLAAEIVRNVRTDNALKTKYGFRQ